MTNNLSAIFQENAKASVLEMVNDIKEEFRNILDEVSTRKHYDSRIIRSEIYRLKYLTIECKIDKRLIVILDRLDG